MWFETLTGFSEKSADQVRSNIVLANDQMISLVNGRRMVWGKLDIPSLAELRRSVRLKSLEHRKLKIREVITDVQQLHLDEKNAGSLFQVASQFNLLEMTSPANTPEMGVGIYEDDLTQGPACAIAAGAGTIYRNYFVPISDRIGQSADSQIDCLADIGEMLGNDDNRLWEMKNGYALATEAGLLDISELLTRAEEDQHDRIRERLRIGIQWDTQVTLDNCRHQISQAYCSALPVAYSPYSTAQWESFARLILEAAYEATFYAAILNAERTGNKTLYLTLLGGGVFGNKLIWITDAIKRALNRFEGCEIDIAIVSYGRSKSVVRQLIQSWHEKSL
jgi:hypothetical protein